MLYESLKVKGHKPFRHQITFLSLLIIFVSPNPVYDLIFVCACDV